MNLSKFFVFVTMFTFLLIAGYLGYWGGELQDFLRKRNEKRYIRDKLGLLDSGQSRGTRGNRERKSIRNTTYNSDAKVMSSVSQGSDDSPKSVTHGVSVDRDQPQVRALDKKNQYATNAGRLGSLSPWQSQMILFLSQQLVREGVSYLQVSLFRI